ncbi:RimJ/RimL family protein N-acetyltransferase [Peribacillus deserti]|uniref:RimJ/RimL family protein N-acetyltransferase n=1 Tax=Peribacillus deserti TaxID=673318 RepID=A0ABS2QG68_9BACI|nr:RimJ/RimL family protein N-acetyltransferase [Peribacillus deserti]
MVNEAFKKSINELRWLPIAQSIPAGEDTEVNLREAHISFLKQESLRFLFNKETQEFKGSTGFHNIDWEIPKCEIGYWFHTKFSGNGFITKL